jgi:Family of unknown function (DUF5996)
VPGRVGRAIKAIPVLFAAASGVIVALCGLASGGFDMAVTRFFGRRAPRLKSDSPNLGEWVVQEAYSHEVSSCGFWPGNGGFGEAAFYSYAYPEPEGFGSAPVAPEQAFYNEELGQFLLPYNAVRLASSPDKVLMDFLQSTYGTHASLGSPFE